MKFASQRLIVSLFIFIGAFFSFTAPSRAATIYADGDASDGGIGTEEEPVNTFAEAMALIVPGEQNTIYATGIFAEAVDIPAEKGGQSEETRTILDQWPGRDMPVNDVTLGNDQGQPVYLAYHLHDTAFVTIRNQRTLGSKATNIWSERSHNILVENNITSNAVEKGICIFNSSDVVVRGNTSFENGLIGIYMPIFSERVLVEQNIAYGNGEHGILAGTGSKEITIQDNQAYDNNWKNVQGGGNLASRGSGGETGLIMQNNTVWGGNTGVSLNNWSDITVEETTIQDTLGDGISIRGSTNARIMKNTITGSEGGMTLSSAQDILVDANIVKNVDRNGVMIMSGSAVTVQNNIFAGNWAGVNVTDPSGLSVINNTIVDNLTGIFIQTQAPFIPEMTLGNNIFADNKTVARVTAQDASRILSDFNAFSGYQSFLFLNGQGLSLSYACAKAKKECHSIDNLDPLFVNPAAGNYHLQRTSPLIGRGRRTGAPLYDMDGDDRMLDGKVDIGADEVL